MMKQRQLIVELNQQKILRATYSERQLQEVLTDFWFNHFNVFAGKGADRILITSYERDAIRPHVLGNFRDAARRDGAQPGDALLPRQLDECRPDGHIRAAIGSPGNAARLGHEQREARQRAFNENYARELLELHTLGVDGGYTQQDVIEVARAFTGWTIDRPRRAAGSCSVRACTTLARRRCSAMPSKPAARNEGEQVLDMLARHPSTASSSPPSSRSGSSRRAAGSARRSRRRRRFLDTNGDLREVVRTILHLARVLSRRGADRPR